ncbi:MAG: ribosome biogenesis GTPase Der [Myxococcota bacterium]
MARLPVVAIVGRPNVGKSTLFNRLAHRRIAVVDDEPGVTRDRIYAMARPVGARFHLIDTGGVAQATEDQFAISIRDQARVAIEEADLVVHLCDARAGLHPDDRFVAGMLRQAGKPTVTVANKVDARDAEDLLPELYELGVEEVLPISAAHGLGVGDLVDKILATLPRELSDSAVQQFETEAAQPRTRAERRAAARAADEAPRPEELAPELDDAPDEVSIPDELKVAVVGRPNAGKSSLVNALLGEPRMVVSEIPGTTRDAVDTLLERDGRRFRLIDTAGLRRKRSVARKVEKLSVVVAVRAIEECHLALLVVDGYEGITEQDAKVAELAHEAGKALIIVVNKWDLVQEGARNRQEYTKRVHKELSFVSYAPVLFISAARNEGVSDVLPKVLEVARDHFTRVSTSKLNKALQRTMERHHLPAYKGRRVSLYYCTQVAVAPPTIVVAANMPEGVHFSYRRYLVNALREEFGFQGTPLRVMFKRRGKDIGRAGHTHRKRTDPRTHG